MGADIDAKAAAKLICQITHCFSCLSACAVEVTDDELNQMYQV